MRHATTIAACVLALSLWSCVPGTYQTVGQDPRVGRGVSAFSNEPVESWQVSESACHSEGCAGIFNGHPANFFYEPEQAVREGSTGDWVYGGAVSACRTRWYVTYERQAFAPPRARQAVKRASGTCGYSGTSRREPETESDVPAYITPADSSGGRG